MALKFKELVATSKVEVGLDFLVIAHLENDGAEPVKGVRGELVLSGGLQPLEATVLVRELASIPVGAAKRMAWAVLPSAAGKPGVKVTVSCNGCQPQEKSVQIEVISPKGN